MIKIPQFTAEMGFAKSNFVAHAKYLTQNSSWNGNVSDYISLAAMDPKQQAYKECLAECRADGGVNCGNRCKAEVFPPKGHGTIPSTEGFPIYGNYCGPLHGDKDGRIPPIDAVDAACRDHDMCYGSTNYFNCGCDRKLLQALPIAIASTTTAEGKAAGMLISAHFLGQPCTCLSPVCVLAPHLCLGIGGMGSIC